MLATGIARAGVVVTASQPATTTATVNTQTQLQASASSSNTVTGWYVYVDNLPVYKAGTTKTINPTLNLATGTHNVMVRAWDSTGTFGTLYLTLTASQPSAPVVTLAAPTTSTVTGPVQFKASAVSKNPITGFVVYANNVNVLQQTGSTLNGTANLTPGNYSVKIRSWDSSGAFGDASTSLSVKAATSSLPTPPATAKVFDHIEDRTGWQGCSDCAADPSNPNPPIAQFWRAQFQTSPALDGSSIQFWIGNGTSYANALHWIKFGDQSWATNFLWDFWVYGGTDMLKAQNLEFDLWQSLGGRKYMFGSQCNYVKGVWQGWNEPTNSWVDLPLACPKFTANTWTHIVWYLQRTSDNKLKYVSLTVNGVTHTLNTIQPSATTNWGNSLGVQFQQDLNKSADAYSERADKIKLTIW